ncbi:MAG: hypothetical protein AAFZ15_09310 [Bacteroidota bacterium]
MICLIFLLAPFSVSNACGPQPFSFHGYTFLNQNILFKKDKKANKKKAVETTPPVVAVFDQFYGNYFAKNDSVIINENIAEWEERYCGLVKKADLEFMVYKSDTTDLEILLTNMGSKSLQVPLRLRGNSFAEYVWENKCTENIEYLIFAKRCEVHVTAESSWEISRRNVPAMQHLIKTGRKAFNRTKSHYMRLRYAYQIIRLAHYAGLYEETLNLYDKLLPKIDKFESRYEESIIPWWIEGHRAGALLKRKRRAEASYLYAKIFRFCPSRRQSAYLSFSIQTDEEWADCLKLCQSDEERAMIYAIRASNPKSRAVEEMAAIYRLDPANPQLEPLLLQEIRKIERHLLGLKFNHRRKENKRRYGVPVAGIENYAIDLQEFVRKVRSETKVPRPNLWLITEGYLEFLAGDFYAAEKTFTEAARKVEDEVLKEQLDAFLLAMEIAKFDKPTSRVEDMAYAIMKENELYRRYPSFQSYLRDKMRYLYEEAGQDSKALLTYSNLQILQVNPVPNMVDELLAVLQKPERTQLERLLTERFSVSDLLDLKAIYMMGEGQMEAAAQFYARIPATEWSKYGEYNPFIENFHDLVNIDSSKDSLTQTVSLNRGDLINTLLELEFQAKGNPEKAPIYYYKLGLAHYNMSYFGYEWKAMDYFRSGTTWNKLDKSRRGAYPYWEYPLGNRENTDVSRALFFFEKARLMAKTSELKAKATFQAARCEQKLFFMSDLYQPPPCCNNIPLLPQEYLYNFDRLKNEFSETDFYEWIIEECQYFAAYARRGRAIDGRW